MFLSGRCRKCLTKVEFDIGDMSIEEAKKKMAKMDMGECPGYHVEVGKMLDYYKIDWEHPFNTLEEAKDNDVAI